MTEPNVKPEPPKGEPVSVTVKPVKHAGVGVYEVTVKVDDCAPGSSVVRTSPREYAFQS